MPTAQKKKPSVSEALLEEVREIRDMLETIERQSKYLKPSRGIKKAGQEIVAGMWRGIGVFIGGVLIIGILAFAIRQALSSEQVQAFIGAQIQSAVSNAVEDRIPEFPF